MVDSIVIKYYSVVYICKFSDTAPELAKALCDRNINKYAELSTETMTPVAHKIWTGPSSLFVWDLEKIEIIP